MIATSHQSNEPLVLLLGSGEPAARSSNSRQEGGKGVANLWRRRSLRLDRRAVFADKTYFSERIPGSRDGSTGLSGSWMCHRRWKGRGEVEGSNG